MNLLLKIFLFLLFFYFLAFKVYGENYKRYDEINKFFE